MKSGGPVHREQRIVTRCRVEFERLGVKVSASSEDLSAAGVFVRTPEVLPVGTTVQLRIQLPDRRRFRVASRVAHVLTPAAARALGRQVGMGFQFVQFDDVGARALADYLADLADEITPPPARLAEGAEILVADASLPRLERLTTALTAARFDVRAVRDGNDAYESVQNHPVDILLLADDLPHMDGYTLMKRLARRPAFALMPMVLMSDDTGDMARLDAYRLGARDFIPRPFTDEELVLRLRRIALERHHTRAAVLRGSLHEITVPTLLSLLDFERKSGFLLVASEDRIARVFVAEGRLMRVEGPPAPTPIERLHSLLDWQTGTFEFTACPVQGSDEIGMRTQTLLLEHARLRDESTRAALGPDMDRATTERDLTAAADDGEDVF